MNEIPISEFKKLSAHDMVKLLPIVITAEGSPVFIMEKPENIIALGEFHPRIQNNLRMQAARARINMPAPKKVYADEVLTGV